MSDAKPIKKERKRKREKKLKQDGEQGTSVVAEPPAPAEPAATAKPKKKAKKVKAELVAAATPAVHPIAVENGVDGGCKTKKEKKLKKVKKVQITPEEPASEAQVAATTFEEKQEKKKNKKDKNQTAEVQHTGAVQGAVLDRPSLEAVNLADKGLAGKPKKAKQKRKAKSKDEAAASLEAAAPVTPAAEIKASTGDETDACEMDANGVKNGQTEHNNDDALRSQGKQEGGKEGTAAKAFRRVQAEEWLDKQGAWDNSYEATFGQNGWGYKASQILSQVRGKDFRHEKTKKKRGTYRGGCIEPGMVASYKFDSDEE